MDVLRFGVKSAKVGVSPPRVTLRLSLTILAFAVSLLFSADIAMKLVQRAQQEEQMDEAWYHEASWGRGGEEGESTKPSNLEQIPSAGPQELNDSKFETIATTEDNQVGIRFRLWSVLYMCVRQNINGNHSGNHQWKPQSAIY
jgi:hypothetical protein